MRSSQAGVRLPVPKLTRALIGLEAANIVGLLDHPNTGTTQFSEIAIELPGSPIRFPTMQWSYVDDVADRITTTINTDGNPFGVITVPLFNLVKLFIQ
ncbi:hypothetical protein C8J57DRAFT_1503805 [Mycena rebaudengoi]|nr:hypothetical protein C8J57DRAFT_1503805 [Mycena rebaudengoi]